MSELVTDRIKSHAERLRLNHIAETADELIERAEKAEMGYREFLDLALEDEVGVREGRRFRNALKLSGLPHHKGLDEFEFAFQPRARRAQDQGPRHACVCGAQGQRVSAGSSRGRQDDARGGVVDRRLPGRLLDLLHDAR